jgi:hypothetical protein
MFLFVWRKPVADCARDAGPCDRDALPSHCPLFRGALAGAGVKPPSLGAPPNTTARALLSSPLRRPNVTGQLLAEDAAEQATKAARRALADHRDTVRAAINASTDFDELRSRLKAAASTASVTGLASVTEKALLLGELAGRASVKGE